MPGQLKSSCIRKIACYIIYRSVRASILRSSQASDAICRHAAVATSEFFYTLRRAVRASVYYMVASQTEGWARLLILLSGDQADCRGKARKGGESWVWPFVCGHPPRKQRAPRLLRTGPRRPPLCAGRPAHALTATTTLWPPPSGPRHELVRRLRRRTEFASMSNSAVSCP